MSSEQSRTHIRNLEDRFKHRFWLPAAKEDLTLEEYLKIAKEVNE